MQTNCGLIIDGETLVMLNGAMTLADSEDVVKAYSSVCGGLCYDSNVFKIEKGIITMKDDEKEEFESILIASCGVKLDGNYFELQNGKLVSTYEPPIPYYFSSQQYADTSENESMMYKYKISTDIADNQRFALLIPTDPDRTRSIYSNLSFSSIKENWKKSYGVGNEYLYDSEETIVGSNSGGGGVYQHTFYDLPYNRKLGTIIAFSEYQAVSDYVLNGTIDERYIVII